MNKRNFSMRRLLPPGKKLSRMEFLLLAKFCKQIRHKRRRNRVLINGKQASEYRIVNPDPINAIRIEIEASRSGRCTYWREQGYYPNGNDRIHELVEDEEVMNM